MQIAINIPNVSIAEKIISMLEHFKNDGVEIIEFDDMDLSDKQILENFRDGLQELKSIKNNSTSNLKSMEEFLNEL